MTIVPTAVMLAPAKKADGLGTYWLGHVLLRMASWQSVCAPGTTWRYLLRQEPRLGADGQMVLGTDGRPIPTWRFAPQENKRISLYD